MAQPSRCQWSHNIFSRRVEPAGRQGALSSRSCPSTRATHPNLDEPATHRRKQPRPDRHVAGPIVSVVGHPARVPTPDPSSAAAALPLRRVEASSEGGRLCHSRAAPSRARDGACVAGRFARGKQAKGAVVSNGARSKPPLRNRHRAPGPISGGPWPRERRLRNPRQGDDCRHCSCIRGRRPPRTGRTPPGCYRSHRPS